MTITLNSMLFAQAPVLASGVRLVSSASDGTPANNNPGGGLSFNAYFGEVYTPAVSITGRYVAFKSMGSNLVAGDTNTFRDIFWKDTVTGAIQRVDISTVGAQSNADDQSDAQARLSISSDGQQVAFSNAATNLVAGDSNSASDVFVRNIAAGTTTLVSTSSAGVQGNNASNGARMSGNGRFVAFSSVATNLVANDLNGHQDVFVKDLQTNITTSITNPFNQFVALTQGISSDGRYVLFLTDANNIDNLNAGGEFVYDRTNATYARVNTSTTGALVIGDSIASEDYILSADGRHVAFVSGQSTWGPVDTNGVSDVYEKNLDTGVVTLVSKNAAGQQNSTGSNVNSLSDDGRYVSFGAINNNAGAPHVAGVTPFSIDAQGNQTFVKDMQTGTLTDVTRNAGGTSVPGGSVVSGQLSGDGLTVTYGVGSLSPTLPGVRADMLELFQTPVAGADVVRDDGDGRTVSLKLNTSGAGYVFIQAGDYGEGFAGAVPSASGDTTLSFHFADDYFGDLNAYGSDGSTFGSAATLLASFQAIVRTASGNATITGTGRNNLILAGLEDNVITTPGGNSYVNAGAGNDKVTTGAGNDSIVGGAGNDNIDGGGGTNTAMYAGPRANYTITNNGNGSLTVKDISSGSPDGTDTLANIQFLAFSDATIATSTISPPPGTNFSITNTTTGAPSTSAGEAYTGPVAGLAFQYIYTGTDNLNVTGKTANEFIHTGSGFDAIDVSGAGGTNVLDGGTNSNFLVGGTAAGTSDTFFVDDRAPPSDIWSTVGNFHAGDAATLFGITQKGFTTEWVDGQGAAGFTGVTLHVTAGGVATASITLAGYTVADLSNGRLSQIFGMEGDGTPYLYIHGDK